MKKSSTRPIPIITSASPSPIEQSAEERQLSRSIGKDTSPIAECLEKPTSSNTEGYRLFRPSPVPTVTSTQEASQLDDQEGCMFPMDP
ncbi:MAG: hypothetical protein EBY16_04440 [Gammaproteobacteria bacterium]|nr:hypothetical protein [Gammaproteobacteria bacterium]